MTANHLVRRARAAVSFLVLTSPLFAQSLTVPDSVAAGAEIRVQYANLSLANRTIVIVARGGVPLTTREIYITLDGQGKGSAAWTPPPGWTLVSFDGPAGEQAETLVQ